jgi:hypothetical protein
MLLTLHCKAYVGKHKIHFAARVAGILENFSCLLAFLGFSADAFSA